MIAIDEPALCFAHSLKREFGRNALEECRRRIDNALARKDDRLAGLWAEARDRLLSGRGLRH